MGYIIDQESIEEMARLKRQAAVMDRHVQDLYPERVGTPASVFHDVLDIGCGPGTWLLDTAAQHPQMHLHGLDSSERMIEYDRMQTEERDLPNVHFHVHDALKTLPFADQSFDLVNIRLISGFMHRSAWVPLFRECRRLLRPGGRIQVTDGDFNAKINAPALIKLSELIVKGQWKLGQSFCESGPTTGVTAMLPWLFKEAGLTDIETMAHAIDYSYGTPAYGPVTRDFTLSLPLLKPFLLMSNLAPQEEIEALIEQGEQEMQSKDFRAVWFLLTAFARKAAS